MTDAAQKWRHLGATALSCRNGSLGSTVNRGDQTSDLFMIRHRESGRCFYVKYYKLKKEVFTADITACHAAGTGGQ
jgi:hypothetical protein